MKTPIQELISQVQRMREEGNTDLRTVIYKAELLHDAMETHLRMAYKEGYNQCSINAECKPRHYVRTNYEQDNE